MPLVGAPRPGPPVKPQAGLRIDRGNPLAKELAAFWYFGEGGGGPVETVRGDRATLVAAPAWVTTPRGKALRLLRASVQYAQHAQLGDLTGVHPMTVLAVVRQNVLSNLTRNIIAFGDQAAPANGWSLRTGTASATQTFVRIGTGSVTGTAATAVSNATDYFLLGAWADGANVKFFRVNLNTRAFASETIVNAQGFQTPADWVCRLGNDVSTTAASWDGDLVAIGVWRYRKLTDHDVRIFADNPWQVLRQPQPMRWAVLAATGADITRSLVEGVAHTEALARVFVGTRALAESRAHADAAARAFVGTRALAESRAHTDAATRVSDKPRTLAESVAHSEALARTFSGARTLAESIAHADAAARAFSGTRTLAESIAHSDATARVAGSIRALSEGVAHTDAATRAKAAVRALAESIAHTDAAARVLGAVRALAESIAHTDAADRSVTGGGASITRAIAESIAHSDAAARVVGYIRATAEGAAHGDAAARVGTFARGLAESIAHGDSATATIAGAFAQVLVRAGGVAGTLARAAGALVSAARGGGAAGVTARSGGTIGGASDRTYLDAGGDLTYGPGEATYATTGVLVRSGGGRRG